MKPPPANAVCTEVCTDSGPQPVSIAPASAGGLAPVVQSPRTPTMTAAARFKSSTKKAAAVVEGATFSLISEAEGVAARSPGTKGFWARDSESYSRFQAPFWWRKAQEKNDPNQ